MSENDDPKLPAWWPKCGFPVPSATPPRFTAKDVKALVLVARELFALIRGPDAKVWMALKPFTGMWEEET